MTELRVVPLPGVPCRECGAEKLRIEFRTRLTAKPIGSFSISGYQMKVAALGQEWPWMVCDNCGEECEGKIDE